MLQAQKYYPAALAAIAVMIIGCSRPEPFSGAANRYTPPQQQMQQAQPSSYRAPPMQRRRPINNPPAEGEPRYPGNTGGNLFAPQPQPLAAPAFPPQQSPYIQQGGYGGTGGGYPGTGQGGGYYAPPGPEMRSGYDDFGGQDDMNDGGGAPGTDDDAFGGPDAGDMG